MAWLKMGRTTTKHHIWVIGVELSNTKIQHHIVRTLGLIRYQTKTLQRHFLHCKNNVTFTIVCSFIFKYEMILPLETKRHIVLAASLSVLIFVSQWRSCQLLFADECDITVSVCYLSILSL